MVLACLARGRGQVVAEQDILDEVWDHAYDGGTSIIEVYVSTPRRKIDAPFGPRSIQTVHR
ncbi:MULTISPECIES: winged helix-turn-helix domain-containing protein [unclassified Streptomyces]|uniref:winged helix-turn-helix domain-containing protein n=1 Tax=unclassified Streptomyces TaxID=2593676 RepID=UPI0003789FCB|nr:MULTISPECIES: winged helix-turn-helix domain-containing protein [unclassified Streptomyces]MYT27608.1 winged helix family transcriptional regulator [Streptomyces sp. SID8354]